MENYIRQIRDIKSPSFTSIQKIAIGEVSVYSQSERDKFYQRLDRGLALLDDHPTLCQYLYSFGKMHQAKLQDAFKQLPSEILDTEFDVIDWGCGQAMGTINLFDYINQKGKKLRVRKVTLIEPSQFALKRALLHTSVYLKEEVEVNVINKFFEAISGIEIEGKSGVPVIHIFSNILDVAQIDLKHLANLIDSTVVSDNYLVCVGPLNATNKRIDHFYQYFSEDLITSIAEIEDRNYFDKWTFKCRIYKLEVNEEGHLIPVEFYPPVQFQSAYELDIIRQFKSQLSTSFRNNSLGYFEVAAPFDLGASVYEDVHPVLAVLNNIITRGIPTKSSLFLEEHIQKAFGFSEKQVNLGAISYPANEKFDEGSLIRISDLDQLSLDKISGDEVEYLQILLSPVAIGRFHKILIEALLTGHISFEAKTWKILIEEGDVSFSALAIEDFKHLFKSLVGLSSGYSHLQLPEIDLVIVSNKIFSNSPLHLGCKVYEKYTPQIGGVEYDMVFTLSMLKSVNSEIELFSRYRVKNNCYFNVLNSTRIRSQRSVYTSNLIHYKNLVEKDSRGNFSENEENVKHLTYFLQLFFRKESFRPGQLPILDRALKNEPVIGLLPTGGGKSLTYQIAALLQPGITLVVDPLKSLMKDQYDGLLTAGIDSCGYINSTQTAAEKKIIETQLESSQLLFLFLSPERLAILSFRRRLEHMHDYNVYFSYGVIDEVHCVSEWGHDFRFSYLHLGRNLYNYVKAKDGAISLFGLTATASFDVLADVERELSGNGAFDLDPDTIVRFENSNRLELQYKIEKVPVKFAEDTYYDKYGKMPSHLPRAVNVTSTNTPFDSKASFLKEYIKNLPGYIRAVQKTENLEKVTNQFYERQGGIEISPRQLEVDMPSDFYTQRKNYEQAGIIFCPHARSTPLSVEINSRNLKETISKDVGSFSGKDEDDISIENLEKFRDNKLPIMVATKAFGMGIDKPNVRFTINMNYSSSLEAFVQESGRAGRDRRIALSIILVSDYRLARISPEYADSTFPLGIIKNKWFNDTDLQRIINEYGLSIPEKYLTVATPSNDIVKLHCSKDNKMFGFNECSSECSEYSRCVLRKVSRDSKGWKPEMELIQDLKAQGLSIGKKNFQYLNPDYRTVMFFFGSTFKGDIVEKQFMHSLLNQLKVEVEERSEASPLRVKLGFLSPLLDIPVDHRLVIFIPYTEENSTDISKAIYRMCCIELIEDFTQDYSKKQFRIEAVRRREGGYFEGLEKFLLRYYTADRAKIEIGKVIEWPLSRQNESKTTDEIYKCLGYLTEFVYDKISEKRKRAIDDMRNFCIEGLQEDRDWTDLNEDLKNFLFYYFNSKFAKADYVTDEGEAFSLMNDTEEGKRSDEDVLFKYLRVIDDDVVGIGTPLDNVKHLYGAVRLISRSLTDENPTLALLESFCLSYMQVKNNENLKNQLVIRYSTGMIVFHERIASQGAFWDLFNRYNQIISPYLSSEQLEILIEETSLLIHSNQLTIIKSKYLA